jgi:hypothetical protein
VRRDCFGSGVSYIEELKGSPIDAI